MELTKIGKSWEDPDENPPLFPMLIHYADQRIIFYVLDQIWIEVDFRSVLI